MMQEFITSEEESPISYRVTLIVQIILNFIPLIPILWISGQGLTLQASSKILNPANSLKLMAILFPYYVFLAILGTYHIATLSSGLSHLKIHLNTIKNIYYL